MACANLDEAEAGIDYQERTHDEHTVGPPGNAGHVEFRPGGVSRSANPKIGAA
jgi:hypothetical protein